MSYQTSRAFYVDFQSYENLKYLKRKLFSPETWITRKLVELDAQKYINSDDEKLEVVAR